MMIRLHDRQDIKRHGGCAEGRQPPNATQPINYSPFERCLLNFYLVSPFTRLPEKLSHYKIFETAHKEPHHVSR